MHAQEFLKLPENKLKSGVYVLYGEESFYIQKVREKIIQMNTTGEEDDYQVFDMEVTPIQEAIHDCETFPFFSDSKVVVVNRAHFLTGQIHKSEIEHHIELLAEYVQNPVEFTALIIIAPYPKIDQRKKITKTIKENCMMIECASPKLYEMKSTLEPMATARGLNLTDDVIELLLERIGEHIEALDQELEKLALYATEGTVTIEQAQNLVSTHAEASTFNLIDALTDGDLGKTLSLLKEFKKRNEEPIALLALVASQLRLILQSKLMKRMNYQQQQIAKLLKVHPYAVKMALKRERQFTQTQLKEMIIDAADCDEQMKTREMDKWLALELFLEKAGQKIDQSA